MHEVYQRVCNWNAKRYDRILNLPLASSLLSEELDEWDEATTEVDQLDALCDIVYVAMGIVWKSNTSNEVAQTAANTAYNFVECLLEAEELLPMMYYAGPYIALMEDDKCSVVLTANICITLALAEMLGMGLSQEQIKQALLVVCDSNDSKSVHKTASHIKANGNSKGPYFVAPEPRLQEILDARA